MSVGHQAYEKKSKAETTQVMGLGDTPKLYARAKRARLDHSKDVYYGAGISVDGKTVYIDRRLYQEVMTGKVAVRGMSPRQIIDRWRDHEESEWAIEVGDNPSDSYPSSHGYATTKEEEGVEAVLGEGSGSRYEDQIAAGLARCQRRDPVNPPLDLWCGPILDNPTQRDKQILTILRRCGVEDAFKVSKVAVHYGTGGRFCHQCKMMECPGKTLSKCDLVSGLIRRNRQCDRFVARKKAA